MQVNAGREVQKFNQDTLQIKHSLVLLSIEYENQHTVGEISSFTDTEEPFRP